MSRIKLVVLLAGSTMCIKVWLASDKRRRDRDMDGFEIGFNLAGVYQPVTKPIHLGQPVIRELLPVRDFRAL
jgi:hypothetical protein